MTVGLLLLVGVIVVADRATKELAVRQVVSGRRFVRVVFTKRPLLGRSTSLHALIVAWVASLACALCALVWAPSLHHNVLITAGVASALAGASGNLADRMIRGAVVDFVAIGRWPPFNLADVAIVAGAAVVGGALLSGR